jgi:nitrite reductase (NADH) small subunit
MEAEEKQAMGWVWICMVAELPPSGEMLVRTAGANEVCIANEDGILSAIDNICPHRGGPLAEGSLEEGKSVCLSWSRGAASVLL